MLGGAGTKRLNPPKMPDWAGLEKASSTQYLRWGFLENLFSLKMLGEVGIQNPFNLIC